MIYDLIIIGQGPAGLSAAIYGARYNLKTLVLGSVLAGNMGEAWKVENYPGFEKISGLELADKMKKQAEKLGAEIKNEEIVKIKKEKGKRKNDNQKFIIITRNNKTYQSRSLILASGTQHRKLNVKGEEKFHGKGVAYCATCDGAFFKNKKVVVVGGGDSAIKSVLLLSKYASKVYLLVRGDKLSGEPQNRKTISGNPKIEIIYNISVSEILGDNKVASILLSSGKKLETDGIFIEIGAVPASALTSELKVKTDNKGFIVVDTYGKTSAPFIYAAGDITNTYSSFKQILIAASQGAVAAHSAYEDLTKKP